MIPTSARSNPTQQEGTTTNLVFQMEVLTNSEGEREICHVECDPNDAQVEFARALHHGMATMTPAGTSQRGSNRTTSNQPHRLIAAIGFCASCLQRRRTLPPSLPSLIATLVAPIGGIFASACSEVWAA
jgi:hypothetical protein